ncbi:MAG: hypothetical protein IJ542_01110 [Clostridia bacterium]|nr:hypothetical protein [Clostridia bacterium]
MSEIAKINLKKEQLMAQQPPTLVGRALPVLLILSFAFSSLYNVARSVSATELSYFSNVRLFFAVDLLLVAVVQYLVYLLVLWVYKSILKTRPYFALLSERDFKDAFGVSYVLRNVFIGLISLCQFWFPYLSTYMASISLIVSYLMITATYLLLSKKMNIMFKHFYYRLFMIPWFIWEAITILFTLIFGGLI